MTTIEDFLLDFEVGSNYRSLIIIGPNAWGKTVVLKSVGLLTLGVLSEIVYKEADRFNNITVLFNNEFIEVNYKRLKLEFTAEELYPEGYDLNQLFLSYKERKLERDIERGSKKALKKFRKQEGL